MVRKGSVAAAACGMALAAVGASSTTHAAAATSGEISAIGNEVVNWIDVSPAYAKTGTVLATAVVPSCKSDCMHLWISHDGGASWHRAAATNWSGTSPEIALDAAGHEVIYTASPSGDMLSLDDGSTWQVFGANGYATASPGYAKDGLIAVAADKTDYVYASGATHTVPGSKGTMRDAIFGLAPSFPSGGSQAPVLLSGLDPQTGQGEIERCDQNFACANPAPLVGSSGMNGAARVITSTGYGTSDQTVFAKSMVGVYKSTDGAHTFSRLVLPTPAGTVATPMLAVGPDYREDGPDRSLYVAVQVVHPPAPGATPGGFAPPQGGVYASHDGGSTWAQIGTQGDVLSHGALAVAVAPDGRLFAGYFDGSRYGGLVCSTNQSTWQATCPAVGPKAAAAASKQGTGANGTPCASCPNSAGGAQSSQAPDAAGGATAPGTGGGANDAPGSTPASAHSSGFGGIAPILAIVAAVLAIAAVGLRFRRRSREEVPE